MRGPAPRRRIEASTGHENDGNPATAARSRGVGERSNERTRTGGGRGEGDDRCSGRTRGIRRSLDPDLSGGSAGS